MDDGADDEISLKSGGAIVHHVSKRVRRDKSTVIVFDEADRRDFVTGFHKRKKKRRKIAEMQKKFKERQKRLQERRERRIHKRIALGEAAEGHNNGEEVEEEEEGEEEIDGLNKHPIQDIVSYEDADTKTIVTTCPIMSEDNIGTGFKNNCSINVHSYDKAKVFSTLSAEEKVFKNFHKNQQKHQTFPRARGKQHQPKSFSAKRHKK